MSTKEEFLAKAKTTPLPKLVTIVADPENAPVPEDVHFQYVVASAITKFVNQENKQAFVVYLKRLNPDIALMAMGDIIQRAKFPEKDQDHG